MPKDKLHVKLLFKKEQAQSEKSFLMGCDDGV
jgi:hypothetical protein